jgi:CPA2 family monovalent cation:H+ antiporter-2
MILVGTRIIPYLLHRVARWNSRELFMLTITAIGLGVGYGTYLFGLSFAFGAFIAGMVLSESDYGHQALGDITPLRDIFSLLFFASVGMLLNPQYLLTNFSQMLLIVVLVMGGKGLIFYLLSRLFGYGNIVPLATGLGLLQVGEFSFVLARIGVSTNSIGTELYSLILSTAVVTMVLTPFISGLTAPLYSLRKRWFKHEPLQTINLPQTGLIDHVVIAGGGRVGQYVAKVLQSMDIAFVIVELNYFRIEQAKKAGFPLVYGDASQVIVLEAARIHKAKLLLITIPNAIISLAIADQVRKLNSGLHIVARAMGADQIKALHDRGVYNVVQPEFEASSEFIRQALRHLNISIIRIQQITNALRQELYATLNATDVVDRTIAQLPSTMCFLDLNWVHLNQDSPMIRHTIKEMGIRTNTGVSVVGVMREGTIYPNPNPDFQFAKGDLVGVMGESHQIEAFQRLADTEGNRDVSEGF